jgi:hypothetical protein
MGETGDVLVIVSPARHLRLDLLAILVLLHTAHVRGATLSQTKQTRRKQDPHGHLSIVLFATTLYTSKGPQVWYTVTCPHRHSTTIETLPLCHAEPFAEYELPGPNTSAFFSARGILTTSPFLLLSLLNFCRQPPGLPVVSSGDFQLVGGGCDLLGCFSDTKSAILGRVCSGKSLPKFRAGSGVSVG